MQTDTQNYPTMVTPRWDLLGAGFSLQVSGHVGTNFQAPMKLAPQGVSFSPTLFRCVLKCQAHTQHNTHTHQGTHTF